MKKEVVKCLWHQGNLLRLTMTILTLDAAGRKGGDACDEIKSIAGGDGVARPESGEEGREREGGGGVAAVVWVSMALVVTTADVSTVAADAVGSRRRRSAACCCSSSL
jgi:hypothetical protein